MATAGIDLVRDVGVKDVIGSLDSSYCYNLVVMHWAEAVANRLEGPASFLLGAELEEVAAHSHSAAKALAGRIGDLGAAVTADRHRSGLLDQSRLASPPGAGVARLAHRYANGPRLPAAGCGDDRRRHPGTTRRGVRRAGSDRRWPMACRRAWSRSRHRLPGGSGGWAGRPPWAPIACGYAPRAVRGCNPPARRRRARSGRSACTASASGAYPPPMSMPVSLGRPPVALVAVLAQPAPWTAWSPRHKPAPGSPPTAWRAGSVKG
jgi:hypothetical protein